MSIDLLRFLLTSVVMDSLYSYLSHALHCIILNNSDLPVALCCFTIYRWHCVVSHLSVLTSITKRKQQVDCSLNVDHGSSLVSFSSLISFPAYVNQLNNFSFNIFEFLWFRLPHMRVVLDIPICNKASVSVVYLPFLCSLPATNWPQRYNEDIVKKMTRKK